MIAPSPLLADVGARGSALAAWWPVWAFTGVLLAAVVALAVTAPSVRHPTGFGRAVLRVPRALERLTGVPAWAASTLLLSIYGLAFAGYGFYTDVAYHVAHGRDDVLFTAPHTAIFAGLVIIALGPMVGVLVATVDEVPTRWRAGNLRVPTATVPLGVLGVAAVLGFPIDELWHQRFGVDVTMWSPPHLIMILAASFSGLASWMVLADAGVRPGSGETRAHRRWSWGLNLVVAALTLQGLSSVQGEFSFGVPQWQQLYHPVLVCLAAGLALVAIRLVLGPWYALGIATAVLALGAGDLLGGGDPIETRPGAVYVGSALLVELVARLAGTGRRLRFALLAGAAVGTGGLAVEWAWNTGAHQPWTAALWPDALLAGLPAALAGAVLGAAAGGAIADGMARRAGRPAGVASAGAVAEGGTERTVRPDPSVGGAPRSEPGVASAPVPAAAVVVALLAALAVLAVPGPRPVGDVTATITLDWVDDDHAVVDVALEPPDAAEGARWFTAGSWQWGGRTIAHMERTGEGTYTSAEALRLTGQAKSLLRLHRGAEMMAVAIRLPADPEYDLDEVAAVDRSGPFVAEQRYLQREGGDVGGWFELLVLGLVAVLSLAWVAALAVAGPRLGGGPARGGHAHPDLGPDGAGPVRERVGTGARPPG
jgi:hypothetical protein